MLKTILLNNIFMEKVFFLGFFDEEKVQKISISLKEKSFEHKGL